MNSVLHDLEKRQLIWRGADICAAPNKLSTGFSVLDKALNGGFPQAGNVHIESPLGIGELRLLLPCLLDTKKQAYLVFIAPPLHINAEFIVAQGIDLKRVLIIYSKTLDDALWSAEQCSKSGACDAIFLWPSNLSVKAAKRLEISALQGQSLVFMFTQYAAQQPLPISLSLVLKRVGESIQLRVKKQKVGWPISALNIPVSWQSRLGSPRHTRIKQTDSAQIYALPVKS